MNKFANRSVFRKLIKLIDGRNLRKANAQYKYREILYFTEDSDEEFRLVTNIFDMPAEDIVSLYKKRWNIELFFKWIKQHLTIKKLVERTFNSISMQVYCALIIYILILLIKYRFKSNLSTFDVFRKFKTNIL
jgi:IS4 transposase